MQPSIALGAVGTGNALSQADLISIVERGAGMYERSSSAFAPIESPASEQARERRLDEWRKVAAGDDEVRFERRLEWDGLTPKDLHCMLGEVRLVEPDKLPAWATLLAEITAEATTLAAAEAPRRCLNPRDPVPFEDGLIALVAAAFLRLRTRCGKGLELFSSAAVGGLERALLRRLHVFFGDTLYLEYALFRSKQASSLDLLWMRAQGQKSENIYRAFVDHLLSGGFRRLWLDYPALARLVATAIESWIDATADLVQRLESDSAELAAWLSPPEEQPAKRSARATYLSASRLPARPLRASEPLRITGVEGLLSDSHHHGRAVAILTLSTGTRLVYKPRSVANEAAWFSLLDWLNHNGSPEQFQVLRVMERAGYGWMEYAGTAPLRDEAAAGLFYRRCGMLLALSYVIGVNDLHFENLIAAGDQPVLVDLETILCHSPIETITGADTDDVLRTVFFESPLRTGLLPRWQTGHGSAVDVSGLGAVDTQRSRVPVPQWKDVNNDQMLLVYETVEGASVTNAAVLHGKVLSPNDYLEEIAGGFDAMYRTLIAQRDEMLAAGGPVAAMAGLHVRFIFRATAFYLMTMKGSRLPHLLRDGADRSIHLEPIAAPLLLSRHKPAGWPLVELERRSMEIEDCPHFIAPVSSTRIEAPPDGIDGLLEAPCFNQTVARLRRLSFEDLENQLGLVRAAFDSRTQNTIHAGPRSSDSEQGGLPPATSEEGGLLAAAPLSRDQMLEEAIRLAKSILSKSVSGAGRPPHWVTLRHLPAIGKSQLDPIGPDLFEGRAGIALLFATLARISGETEFADAARLIADAIRDELAPLDPRFVPDDALVHGLTGIASLAYVYAYLAELLEMPSLVVAARHAARFLTPEAIRGDRRYDVLSGAAGTILALLRLGGDEAIALATQCADHLLANRKEAPSGWRAWNTFEDRPITGQAHGSAGIALALLRLHRVVPDPRFQQAALEAIAFENSSFSEEHGNWRDLRWEQPSFPGGWCHGGPGIALSRVEALAQREDPRLRADVEFAISVVRQNVGEGADHLCCGNFGRVLLLDKLGRATQRPELSAEAHRFAAGLVGRARTHGGYRFMRQYKGYVTFPGVFQGTSGVCLALLSLAYANITPNVIDLR